MRSGQAGASDSNAAGNHAGGTEPRGAQATGIDRSGADAGDATQPTPTTTDGTSMRIEDLAWVVVTESSAVGELRRRASLPPLAPGCVADGLDAIQPIRIDGIADHAAIARAPNGDTPATLRLRALGAPGDVLWLVNGKLEGKTRAGGAFEHAFAQTGEQVITALAAGGAYAQLRIRVLR